MIDRALIKRTIELFPRTDYLCDQAVAHARKGYLKSVAYLRSQQESKWILDQKVERKCESSLVI